MDKQITPYMLKFSQSYTFRDQSYAEIDLSGLEDMTAADMVAAEKYLIDEWIFTPEKEDTLEYIFFIASRFSGLPMQFFMQLKPKDAGRLKTMITEFINGNTSERSSERNGENE